MLNRRSLLTLPALTLPATQLFIPTQAEALPAGWPMEVWVGAEQRKVKPKWWKTGGTEVMLRTDYGRTWVYGNVEDQIVLMNMNQMRMTPQVVAGNVLVVKFSKE